MPDHSIPYYSGERLPQEFSEWLSTIPKGYEWYANDLGKDQSTYTFYKVDADDQKLLLFGSLIAYCIEP